MMRADWALHPLLLAREYRLYRNKQSRHHRQVMAGLLRSGLMVTTQQLARAAAHEP
jgi:hypothetical protein